MASYTFDAPGRVVMAQDGTVERLPLMSKDALAARIVRRALAIRRGRSLV